MPNPTPEHIASRYTRRAFSVLRVAAGLSSSADTAVARLGRELQRIVAGEDLSELGRRDLSALLREIEAAVVASYARLGAEQVAAVRELLTIEAEWSANALRGSAPTQSALDRMLRGFLVLGSPPDEQWRRQVELLARRVSDAVREAHALGSAPDVVRSSLGDLIDTARRDAQALADVSATSAGNAGRVDAARANGAIALRWHAVLDQRVTTGCALRHGLMYTLDYEPIGHSVPIERPPPRHWGCRSILLPLLRMPRPTDRPVGSFEEFVNGLSPDEQDDVLGVGRADLWRRGVITKSDLVNQRGRTLTLAELRARAD